MNTKTNTFFISACTCAVFAAMSVMDARANFAPARVTSVKIRLVADKATYPEDLGVDQLVLKASDLKGGAYRYKKLSAKKARFTFTNDRHAGGEVYSGTYTFAFTSKREGTWVEKYTGSFTGTTSGSFLIRELDVPTRPVARNVKVKTTVGERAVIRLRGAARDIRPTGLEYLILNKPKSGRLIVNKLPRVVFVPKPGFKGTVNFRYQVKEGKTRSKPATVTIKVAK